MIQEAESDLSRVSQPFNQIELLEAWRKWEGLIRLARKTQGKSQSVKDDQYRKLYLELGRLLRREQQYGSHQYRKLCYQGEKMLKPWVHLETLRNAESNVSKDLVEQVSQITEQLTPQRVRLTRHWFFVGSLSILCCAALTLVMFSQSEISESGLWSWMQLELLRHGQSLNLFLGGISLGFRLFMGALLVMGVGFFALRSTRSF